MGQCKHRCGSECVRWRMYLWNYPLQGRDRKYPPSKSLVGPDRNQTGTVSRVPSIKSQRHVQTHCISQSLRLFPSSLWVHLSSLLDSTNMKRAGRLTRSGGIYYRREAGNGSGVARKSYNRLVIRRHSLQGHPIPDMILEHPSKIFGQSNQGDEGANSLSMYRCERGPLLLRSGGRNP